MASIRELCKWCLLALLALVCVFIFEVLFLEAAASAQISPGPLSQAHASLDGPMGCIRCHAVRAGSPQFHCLDCHQEIASRLRQGRGLHPRLMDRSGGNAACVKCHSEHNGVNFALVKWEQISAHFDHTKTGFTLDGKHLGLACAKCHTPEKISAGERRTILVKDLRGTYLGLSPTCTSCHEDKHRDQLGANCRQCHDTGAWKPVRNFDHAKTRYPLTGAHVEIACQKCHTPMTGGALKYAGLRFEHCSSCHSDPHHAAFQQGCESCHNTSSWKSTAFLVKFDHSTTKYPLTGKHAELGCERCHRGADFKTQIAFQACSDCHNPDPHNGQFAQRADKGRCDACHTTEGFKPARFQLAEHNLTDFPLRGKHAVLECAKCHKPAGRATLYKVKFALCTDCHQDAHRGQFAGTLYFNRCEQCHNEDSYRPSTFGMARHQKSSFPLTGGHVAVICSDCHKPAGANHPVAMQVHPSLSNGNETIDRETRTAVYHFNALSCTTCHKDPHRGEFAARMGKADSAGRPEGCEACHSTQSWRELRHFDHESTRFSLVGAHRALECAACHRPPNLERNLLNVDFKSAPLSCEGCHKDTHAGQFRHGDAVTACMECHNSTKWRPSLFDHEKTTFSLKGAHQKVGCANCHVLMKSVNGKDVLFYKPVPTACAACHGGTVTASQGGSGGQ